MVFSPASLFLVVPSFQRKDSRLRKGREFQTVYREGRKRTSRSFVVFLRSNGQAGARFGVTTPGRLGTAPERNRIRRRTWEILRLEQDWWPQGFDVVINPRRSVLGRDFRTLRRELLSLLQKSP